MMYHLQTVSIRVKLQLFVNENIWSTNVKKFLFLTIRPHIVLIYGLFPRMISGARLIFMMCVCQANTVIDWMSLIQWIAWQPLYCVTIIFLVRFSEKGFFLDVLSLQSYPSRSTVVSTISMCTLILRTNPRVT